MIRILIKPTTDGDADHFQQKWMMKHLAAKIAALMPIVPISYPDISYTGPLYVDYDYIIFKVITNDLDATYFIVTYTEQDRTRFNPRGLIEDVLFNTSYNDLITGEVIPTTRGLYRIQFDGDKSIS